MATGSSMIRLASYQFKNGNKPHANRWYAAANAWNTEGIRAAKWTGYIVVRDQGNVLTAYYYVNRPKDTGVLLAKIDRVHNKLKEIAI